MTRRSAVVLSLAAVVAGSLAILPGGAARAATQASPTPAAQPAPRSMSLTMGSHTVTAFHAVAKQYLKQGLLGTTAARTYSPHVALPSRTFSPHIATIDTWTGGGGSTNWSDAGNWSPGVPANGDAVVFNSTATSVDNIVGLTLSSLTFAGGTISGSQTLSTDTLTDTNTDNNATDTISVTTLTMTGVPSTITVADSILQIDSTITGTNGATVDTTGAGTVRFTANNTYSGQTQIPGLLLVDGTQSGTMLPHGSGAALGGSGTVGDVTATDGAAIFPAEVGSPEILTANAVTWSLGGGTNPVFMAGLAGPVAGTGYSQLVANDFVTINAGDLFMFLLYSPTPGQTFTLLKNQSGSPISGTFSGLPEGSKFVNSGYLFQITYTGGTSGHDIVVTALSREPSTFDGFGLSGLLALNNGSTWQMGSNGTSFISPSQWSSTPFYGARATLTGDVNGDGERDLIALNNNSVWVMPSNGFGFDPPELWSSGAFYGNRTTVVEDVDGDGADDLVAINGTSIWAELSNGTTHFGSPQGWYGGPFYGSRNTLVGDVDGDGNGDLIAVNGTSIWVLRSNGAHFGTAQRGFNGAFYGTVTTAAADVDADGLWDLIAVNGGSTWVLTASSGGNYGTPGKWLSTPFYGSVATLPGDFDGDGKFDIVAVNKTSAWVVVSSGTDFNSPQNWSTTTFYGQRGVYAG